MLHHELTHDGYTYTFERLVFDARVRNNKAGEGLFRNKALRYRRKHVFGFVSLDRVNNRNGIGNCLAVHSYAVAGLRTEATVTKNALSCKDIDDTVPGCRPLAGGRTLLANAACS